MCSYRFRRTPFSAYPFFSTITPRNSENKPQDVVNTVTASAGGPVVKDKVHYYAGFERTYRDLHGRVQPGSGAGRGGGAAAAAQHRARLPERAASSSASSISSSDRRTA